MHNRRRELIKALSYPLPAPPAQSPGIRPLDPPDVSPEYMQKIVWRLAEDSRHKMARSVEAIVRQREALLALVEAHNLAGKVVASSNRTMKISASIATTLVEPVQHLTQ